MNKPKSVIRYLLVCLTILIGSTGVYSQTTIVNYDFNQGTSYSTLSPNLVSNITSSASSTETWQSYTGISSGINAFTVNSVAGNAIAMTSSSGTNTRYFQFLLGGSDLATYTSYKVYMQAQRSATGASTIALAYSTDGTNYINFATTQSPGNGFFEQCQFDLSAISALNLKSAVYFRILASGASGSGTLRIDNFQVRATQSACISPTRLLFKTQPVAATQGSVMNVFSVAAACVSDSIATNCNNGNITLAYSGTDLSGTLTMPVVNGVATFTNIAIRTVQSNVSFTASYTGSCGNLTQAISNTFNVLPLRNENFDGATPTWSYSISTPTVVGSGGIVGTDVTGLKNYGSPNNSSLTKSYSVDNFSGEKGTINSILFSNVTGLNAFDQVKFSFQIGSLGSGFGAGTDNAEYMLIETSLDGGTTWNNLLKNNGYNDHLFALSSLSPVTLSYNANAIYSSGDPLWNHSGFQVDLPEGTTQFKFRITASSNRTNENWAIDNLTLQYVPLSINAGSTQTITCSNPNATLTSTSSTSNATYSWTGPSSGSTPTNSTNIVTVPGTYTITATLPVSGITASATVAVISNTAIPTVSITNSPTITCANPNAVLSATSAVSGVTYSWTPAGPTPTSYSTSALTAGTYTLKVTNPVNGCFSTTIVAVTTNTAYPNINVCSNQTLSLSSPSVNLTGNSSTPGATYSWSPNGSSPTSATTTVSSTGIYTLTATNPSNGCVSSATVLVTKKLTASATVVNFENDTLKGNVSISINDGVPPFRIEWNDNKIPPLSAIIAYLRLSDPSLVVDSVKLKHLVDSLSSMTFFSYLTPGLYPFKIYDHLNDSVYGVAVVGSKIKWFASEGIAIETPSGVIRNNNGINYFYGPGKSIIQTGIYNPGNCFIIASNNIGNDCDNQIAFSNPDVFKVSSIGLQRRDSIALTGSMSMSYFAFDGAGRVNIHFLDSIIYSGVVSSGDFFSMSNDTATDKFIFYKNNVQLVERPFHLLNPEKGLVLKAVMGSVGARISNIIMRTSATTSMDKVNAIITDVSCNNPNSGVINAIGVLSDALFNTPLVYELYKVTNTGNVLLNTIGSPFVTNNAIFQNLPAGKYEVKYAGMGYYVVGGPGQWIQHICSTQFEVAYLPEWSNNQNVSINATDRSLTKNSGATIMFNWISGASTFNKLKGTEDGWIEWTPGLTGINGIGFSDNDVDQNLNTIDYAIGSIEQWRMFVVTRNQLMINALMTSSPISGNYPANSILRLEKTLNTITFKVVNGAVLATFPITSQDLILDASLQALNKTIKHPRISFGCPPREYSAEVKNNIDGGFYSLVDNKLHFKYIEQYAPVQLHYNVYDKKNSIVASNTYGSNIVKPSNTASGDNRFTLDFTSSSYLPGYYILEVINSKNEKQYLRFRK